MCPNIMVANVYYVWAVHRQIDGKRQACLQNRVGFEIREYLRNYF